MILSFELGFKNKFQLFPLIVKGDRDWLYEYDLWLSGMVYCDFPFECTHPFRWWNWSGEYSSSLEGVPFCTVESTVVADAKPVSDHCWWLLQDALSRSEIWFLIKTSLSDSRPDKGTSQLCCFDIVKPSSFYVLREPQAVQGIFSKRNIVIVMENLNVKVDYDNILFRHIIKLHGVCDRNNNGKRLLDFFNFRRFFITETLFERESF